MRLAVHYTPFDATFDLHKLAAAYGTGLLDRAGRRSPTPQVLGYVLDPFVASGFPLYDRAARNESINATLTQ